MSRFNCTGAYYTTSDFYILIISHPIFVVAVITY